MSGKRYDPSFSAEGHPAAFYNAINLRSFLLFSALLTISVSLWFVTAAIVHVTVPPPNGFFYFDQLPAAYWLGIFSTLLLLIVSRRSSGALRTLLEVSSLFMLCLYLIGLSSFVYQDPRFLDTYQHEGNSLSFLYLGGWYNNPVWYVYQFPGSYAFFAEITALAGVDPFALMLYYPAFLSIVVAFLVYVVARTLSGRYASIVSALVMAGFWFQLHISPQSIELIPYLGMFYILLKMFEDRTRWRLLTGISIACVPVFVFSHPESSLATSLGVIGFVILEPLFKSKRLEALKSNLARIWPFLVALVVMVLAWWTLVATAALDTVLGIVDAAARAGVTGFTRGPTAPPTPSPSYGVTLLLEEAMSAAIWAVGALLFVFVRRFRQKEYFLGGLFVAAVSTIPIAVFGNPDVLQRSYMFALFPFAFLSASLLERREMLRIRGIPFLKPFAALLIVLVISFSVVIPVARYGGDSFQYLTESSLAASRVEAPLTLEHSVLVAHPDWYGIKFYGPFYGYEGAILLEQKNITGRPGAFIKVGTYGSNVEYNLNFTSPGYDATADYLSISDFFNNLYLMRFGTHANFYIDSKATLEAQASLRFNLVYSSGTDRLYENRGLG